MNVFGKRIGIWTLLGISLILKISFALVTNLGNDEVYYVNFALYPNWSYFDHPPMVGWLIRMFTLNNSLLFFDEFVRLGAILIGTLNLYVLFRIGKLVKNEEAGIWMALLGAISFYVQIISGLFILPDTGLSLFWLLSIFVFLRFIKYGNEKNLWLYGCLVGLGLFSKYFAVFLLLSYALFAVFVDRRIFKSWKFWLAPLLSFVLFLPIIIWNIQSPYSGLNYHADRVGDESWLPNFKFFFPEFFGQLFYNNPVLWILILLAILHFFKSKSIQDLREKRFLLFSAFPLILTVLMMAMYNRTLPHWSGPAYFSLIVFAVLELQDSREQWLKRGVNFGLVLMFCVVGIGIFQGKTGRILGQTGNSPSEIGKGDFTIDLTMWEDIAQNLEAFSMQQKEEYSLLTHNWFPAAHLDYYYALPNKKKLLVWGDANHLHEYQRINQIRGGMSSGENYLWVTTSHYFDPPKQDLLQHFTEVEGPTIIQIKTGTIHRLNLYIWKLRILKRDFGKR